MLAERPQRSSTLAATLWVLCFFPSALAALFVVASTLFIRIFSFPVLLKLLFVLLRQLFFFFASLVQGRFIAISNTAVGRRGSILLDFLFEYHVITCINSTGKH